MQRREFMGACAGAALTAAARSSAVALPIPADQTDGVPFTAGNLIAKLEKNIDLIDLVHIADVPGRHHPGTGEINYPNIYRKLGRPRLFAVRRHGIPSLGRPGEGIARSPRAGHLERPLCARRSLIRIRISEEP